MSIKKYILISIGSLIFLNSLTIVIITFYSFKNSKISFVIKSLNSNYIKQNNNIETYLKNYKNIAETISYNILSNYKLPKLKITTPYIILDAENSILKNFNFNLNTKCAYLKQDDLFEKYSYFLKYYENKVCIYFKFSINNNVYKAIFYDKNFINNFKPNKQNFNENIIFSNSKFISINDSPLLNKSIININSGLKEDKSYYYYKQNIENTNIDLITFTKKNNINFWFKRFIYFSLFNIFIVIFISLFIFYFITNSITEPIKHLIRNTKNIKASNYNLNLINTKYEEFNELLNSFKDMADKIKTRETTMTNELNIKTQELIRTSKMAAIGTLAGGVAHEFNNIIGAINGHANLALENKSTKEMENALKIAISASDKAFKIVNKLLDFSKIKDMKNETFYISEPIKNVLALLKNDFEQNNITIKLNTFYDNKIKGDFAQIEQVFLNMLINSKHSLQSCKEKNINIYFEVEHNFINIFIKDTGTGISIDNKDKIFEPFFTTKGPYLTDNKASDIEGTGLGLSISNSIIENHNGKILLYDSSENGTIFNIKLPLLNHKS